MDECMHGEKQQTITILLHHIATGTTISDVCAWNYIWIVRWFESYPSLTNHISIYTPTKDSLKVLIIMISSVSTRPSSSAKTCWVITPHRIGCRGSAWKQKNYIITHHISCTGNAFSTIGKKIENFKQKKNYILS